MITALNVREMQIKTVLRCHFPSIALAKIQKLLIFSIGVGKLVLAYVACGSVIAPLMVCLAIAIKIVIIYYPLTY